MMMKLDVNVIKKLLWVFLLLFLPINVNDISDSIMYRVVAMNGLQCRTFSYW